jgi:transposase
MDYPTALLTLPVEELCQLIQSLGTAVQEQEAALSEVQAEIAALKEKYEVPRKTSENSSIPPSTQPKARREKTGSSRQGARPGHQGISRCRREPDRIMECEPVCCEACGADLHEAKRQLIAQQQVVELPAIKAEVVELRRYRRTCSCGHCQDDRYPAGYTDTQQAFGPRIHALLSYFNGTHHVSHDRLQQMMGDVFGVEISAGAIVNSLQRTAIQLEPAATDILETIRQRPIVGSDETGLRMDGKNGWLWVIQTPQESYFAAVDSRAGRVLEELLGDAVIPIWCSDLYSAQLTASARRFSICNAHQLRNLEYASDAGDTVFAPAMQQLLRDGFHLAQQRDDLDPHRYQVAVDQIKADALDLIEVNTSHKDAKRLQKRFRKHFDKIWLFLDEPDVPFTNNASEQALRPAVIHRKVIGAFRTAHGAAAYALYRSIEDTARKRGHNILDALFSALGQPLTLALASTA